MSVVRRGKKSLTFKRADFDFFVERCKYWVEIFGLGDWEVIYDLDESKNHEHLACAQPCIDSRSATIVLYKHWNKFSPENIKEELDRTALHEVIHVVLAKLSYYGRGWMNPRLVDEEDHVCTQRIMRAIYRCLKK